MSEQMDLTVRERIRNTVRINLLSNGIGPSVVAGILDTITEDLIITINKGNLLHAEKQTT